MSNDSVELQKIRIKISNLRTWKDDALVTPTFSQPVIDQFNAILEKIHLLDEQNKFSITHNRQFVEKIAKYIPKIVELSHQNFLQTEITDFNTQLSSIYMQTTKLSDLASSATATRGKVIPQLKQINAMAFMISYHKVSSTVFTKIQQTLSSIISDLTKLGNGAWTDYMAQFPTLLQELTDMDSNLKHLMATHNFIVTAESLQNSLRRIQQKNPDMTIPLQSHQFYLQPAKPVQIKSNASTEEQQTQPTIEEIVCQIKENPDNQTELISLLEETFQEEFKFSSPAKLLQKIINVILTIHPPIDLKSKLFKKSVQLFKFLASSVQFLLQLPDYIFSKAEIADFELAINNVENSVNSITKARKKPAGWTADKSKLMVSQFEDYLLACKNVIKGAEVAEMINTELDPYKIALDLTEFKLSPVDFRFTLVHYPKDFTIHHITTMRALNFASFDIAELLRKGLPFRKRKDTTLELHGVSFKPQFAIIQETTEKLETDIFRFSISQYNDFPVSKSGVTILSIFAELQRTLDYNLLQMHEMPIELLNFRLLSLSLFEQGFPLTNDTMIDDVLRSMAIVFDSYVMFSKLEQLGAVPISVPAQICFLITTCDELSSYDEIFLKHRDYFQSIDMLNIHNESILEHISLLLQDTTTALDNWSCTSIVSKFNQYTKTIYTCSTQLKKVSYIDPLLTKLLAQLSSWLGNLSRTLPKPTNLREMQIRMTVLHQLFTNFLETNEEMKKLIPFEQLTEVIQLFKKLRDSFATKTKLKQLLCFLERVQVNPDEQFSSDENSSMELDEVSMQHSESHDSFDEDDQFEIDENVKFDFTLEEINSWIEFSQTILKSSCYQRKKEFPVNSLSPQLIFNHFKELVTKYCDMWRLETTFSDEITQEFLPMLSQGVEISIPSLDHFFTSNYKHYESFRDKMMIHIKKHLEKVIKSLSEFTPTPRGRGFQRETQSMHPNAQEIGDINKSLQILSQNITNSDFSWYPELVRLYHQLNPLLGEATIGSDGTHPCSSFRRLCRKAYLCFLLTRCFRIFSAHNIPYGPDLESLRCLITDFMEDPTLANLNTAMSGHQIEEIMNSDIGSDTFVFGNSMDYLRRALSLINVKAIVEMIDADFFSFDEFFSKLPINVSSLSTLLSSSLFQSVEAARKAMFVLISSNYDDTIAYKSLKALQNFLQEISNAPFEIDKSQISTSMKACRIIQSLSDVSTTFDCLDVFTPRPQQKDGENLINGSYVLRVRILLIALEARMKILMILAGDQFSKLFQLVGPVIDSLSNIPDNFGFIDASQPAFKELREAWMNLCDKFTPVNLIPQMARFKEISKSIPNVFLDSAEHPDIQSITQKALKYVVTHDPSYLIQIQISYLFLEKQVKRYLPNAEFITFPFCEVQNILTVLMKFNEVCALIPCITERINAMNIGAPILNPQNYEIEDLNQFPDDDVEINDEEPILGKPLELEDQVKLAIMIDTTSNANMACKEQIAQLPFQQQQEKCLEPFIEREKIKNDSLAILNRYISEPITSMKNKMTDDGKIQTRIDEMAELNKLELKDKFEKEQSSANQNHLDKLFKSCLDTEKSLENQISMNRMMINEREFIEKEVKLEQIDSIMNSMEYEKKIRNDFREKIKGIARPFGPDDEEIEKARISNEESISITPIVLNCSNLTEISESYKQKTHEIESEISVDENKQATIEQMIEEKENLEKECNSLQSCIASMNDLC